MRLLFFLSFFISILFSQTIDTSFITKFEYGAMLYENPRGIGCVKCHGRGDKPVVIARYKQKDKKSKKVIEKSIIAPAINNVSFSLFIDKMTADKTESKVMPTYFLTDEELKSLYYYIKNLNKK
ncbi:c-type cytochrome [Halarcobacter anaerophilus]|uniref:c-type cytochrome n=1 Tax=Halarcobacter anaerophilus TaxID=877500 RepID=UPI0005C8CB77|nr:c-type cytochrome [Halarcobacter anaerophilus]QDF28354.1 cytochrome c [Halarcobacter anaerophilus]